MDTILLLNFRIFANHVFDVFLASFWAVKVTLLLSIFFILPPTMAPAAISKLFLPSKSFSLVDRNGAALFSMDVLPYHIIKKIQ